MATETDKVNTGALATLVAVGAFAMVAISLSLVALVRDQLSNELAVKDASQDATYQALKKEQLSKLESGVPIETAMTEVVRQISADPLAATPPGAASAAPAPAAGGTGGAAGADAAATGGVAGGPAATDTDLAPEPNRVKDGKLSPGDGAPVPAPKPSGDGQ